MFLLTFYIYFILFSGPKRGSKKKELSEQTYLNAWRIRKVFLHVRFFCEGVVPVSAEAQSEGDRYFYISGRNSVSSTRRSSAHFFL